MSRLEQLKALSRREEGSDALYWQIAGDAEIYGIPYGAMLHREICAEEAKEEAAAKERAAAAAAAMPKPIEPEKAVSALAKLGGQAGWAELNEALVALGLSMSSAYRAVRNGLIEERMGEEGGYYLV